MSDFIDELLELMPDKLGVIPGSLDPSGGFVPSGAAINLSCHIEGGNVRITDVGGQEKVSRYQVYVGSDMILDAVNFRYNLPARYPGPRDSVPAMKVDNESDEDPVTPASHAVVFFP